MTSALATGTTASVIPGPAQLIQPAYAQSTLIVNNDTANAVWLSASSTCAPGQGIKLGALGSIQWAENTPSWACVDIGITSPVSLFLSSAAANPVNPVDVATAVATELLETGVPTKLVTKTIYNAVLGEAGGSTIIDVSEYQSISIIAAPNTGRPTQLQLTWLDANGSGQRVEFWDTYPPGPEQEFNITLNVLGPSLAIVNGDTSNIQLVVTGSSKSVPFIANSMLSSFGPDSWSLNQTWTVNENSTLSQALPSQKLQGSVTANFGIGTTTVSGRFFLNTRVNGTVVSIVVADSAEMHVAGASEEVTKPLNLPVNQYTVSFQTFTAGTFAVAAAFIPGGN